MLANKLHSLGKEYKENLQALSESLYGFINATETYWAFFLKYYTVQMVLGLISTA